MSACQLSDHGGQSTPSSPWSECGMLLSTAGVVPLLPEESLRAPPLRLQGHFLRDKMSLWRLLAISEACWQEAIPSM